MPDQLAAPGKGDNMKITDSIHVKSTPSSEEKAPKEATIVAATKVKSFDSNESVPANWMIYDSGNGNIKATNSVTNRLFEGTPAEFSELLRG
jgi:hypothetical protein